MAKHISTDDIADGMLVAETIINKFGQTLIPAGATLKESHKRLLKTWNIRSIAVKIDESEQEVEITDEQKAIAMEYLSQRLAWSPRNEIEEDFIDMGLVHIAAKLSKKKTEF